MQNEEKYEYENIIGTVAGWGQRRVLRASLIELQL
jgi:hypothetical protein